MKHAYILIFLITLSGCARHRSMESTNKERRDSVSNSSLSTVTERSMLLRDRERRDSLFSIPIRFTEDTFDRSELNTVFTNEGKELPRTLESKSGGITATMTATPQGKVILKCTCDSLQFLVTNLTTEKEYLSKELQARDKMESFQKSVATNEISKSKTVNNSRDIVILIVFLLFIFFILFIIYKVIK